MAKLTRFGVSMDKELVKQFDRYISERDYSSRSEALRDLIRNNLVRREWAETGEVAGGISIVYDHHRRDLVNNLLDIQHDYHGVIISTQHVHLSHEHCLEIIIVKGQAKAAQALTNKLRSLKGVMHCDIARATTAEKIK